MLKRLIWIASFVVTLVLMPQVALAAVAEPITDQPLQENLNAKETLVAFIDAGAKRGWTVRQEADQHLIAEIVVRKHFVAVDIKLHDGLYDITYRDSDNMKYRESDGRIHSSYNKWVRNLNADIQAQLKRASMLK